VDGISNRQPHGDLRAVPAGVLASCSSILSAELCIRCAHACIWILIWFLQQVCKTPVDLGMSSTAFLHMCPDDGLQGRDVQPGIEAAAPDARVAAPGSDAGL
jgi:hypothetical protein